MSNKTSNPEEFGNQYTTVLTTTTVQIESKFDHLRAPVQVVNAFLTLICLWLILAFYIRGRRKGCWTFDRQHRDQLILQSVAMLVPTVTLLRLAVAQGVTVVSEHVDYTDDLVTGDRLCAALVDSANALYGAGSGIEFVFYWKRQRKIYSFPRMKHLKTEIVRGMSNLSLIVTAINFPFGVWAMVGTATYRWSAGIGCHRDRDTFECFNLAFVAFLVFHLMSQIIILSIYLHPLIEMRRQIAATSRSLKAIVRTYRRLQRAMKSTGLALFLIVAVPVSVAVSNYALKIPGVFPSTFAMIFPSLGMVMRNSALVLAYSEPVELITFGAWRQRRRGSSIGEQYQDDEMMNRNPEPQKQNTSSV